ncbi:hypothetical protein [Gillisia hiemivivida]|uniref:Uncharacterized protein n=1 Tax=Gillisia hiemivivida TaxID=291190 RepID=A0A5C6ZSQ6_9FLAO|nr:hypothetical protein [Gillisia hiemivivida]TXD92850.1 hypothetical protein ES724_12240 [Gillisia hiemivivida]
MEENFVKIKKYLYKTIVGFQNKLKFGFGAPEFGELIFVDPRTVDNYLAIARRNQSGKILGGDWDLAEKHSIDEIPRYIFCKMRWEQNIPWAETGIYEYLLDKIKIHGSVAGCYDLQDIIIRYQKLDKLFLEIKISRKFKTQKELDISSFNEDGGLLFHIDRDNQLIFGGGGMHRFSMAKILKLESIPAQLGLLHPEAINKWQIHKLSK